MALTYGGELPLGSKAPDFALSGTDGKTYSLASFSDKRVLVVVFSCNHCPYAQAYEDRLVAIQRDYDARGVQLVVINPNDAERYPDDSFPEMVRRAKEKGFNFPYLHDPLQSAARAYRAQCTPDVFAFDAERKLRYAGRIDDSWESEKGVSSRDLRKAIDAILEGKAIDFVVKPAMGCSIKWRG